MGFFRPALGRSLLLAKALRACAVPMVAAAIMGTVAAAGATSPRGSRQQDRPSAATDAGAPVPEESGRPICVRVGTRSEGWAWPSGRFIHWAKCKGVVPKCQAESAGHEVEGWYAGGALIVAAHCDPKRH
jgi:hypothetical protein